MAIVTAASNTSSFTPEPNPDSKITTATQKPAVATDAKAPETKPEPAQRNAIPMELSANGLEQKGRSTARRLLRSFEVAFSDELAIGMEEIISTFIPAQDRMWADVIDVAAQEIQTISSLPSRDQRSLGSAD